MIDAATAARIAAVGRVLTADGLAALCRVAKAAEQRGAPADFAAVLSALETLTQAHHAKPNRRHRVAKDTAQ
jgi:hypothetical protein